ncbi:MAG: PqqD family protein [Akkermansiaceae bacterium]|nr:PqqD family protein [Akkermansiaceae bacterium]
MSQPPTRLSDLMLNDRGYVFDPNTGESYQLSATGLAVVRGLLRGEGVAAILKDLIRGHEVDPLEARADLDAFLWDLQQLGWL